MWRAIRTHLGRILWRQACRLVAQCRASRVLCQWKRSRPVVADLKTSFTGVPMRRNQLYQLLASSAAAGVAAIIGSAGGRFHTSEVTVKYTLHYTRSSIVGAGAVQANGADYTAVVTWAAG